MSHSFQNLTLKKIFIFWLPLGATWLMMSIEGPYLSALIARLEEPKYNLAAYGVAYALALIIEAPVIMIMSASTALAKDTYSFHKLKKFTYALITGVTLLMIFLIIPQIFYYLAEELIGLPHYVAHLTHIATIIMLPWPGAIGYRRFYQGVLIRNNLTRRVAYGTIVRLTFMSLSALIIFTYFHVPGVVIGATSLTIGVLAEAISSRLMTISTIKKHYSSPSFSTEKVSHKEIFIFYYPLALMSFISLGVQPFVTFFVGQSRMALESLAVLPVITSFVFIFRAIGLSFQEVIIAKIGDDKSGYAPLRNFAAGLAVCLSLVIIIVAFSPLSDVWFKDVSGLSQMLSDFSKVPLQIIAIIPALTVLLSFQRAILVTNKNTKPITWGTAIEFMVIIVTMFFAIKVFSLVGAIAATSSLVIGRLAANTFFIPHTTRFKLTGIDSTK